MKRFISQTFLIALAMAITFVFTGCATSGSSTTGSESVNSNTTVEVRNPNIELTDYLRRIPGVLVSGNGPTARITIRGINTFVGSTDPLFVINGIRVGRDFRMVYSQVNMHDVTSVEVLKGPDASAYGVEGGNGVVVINYKQ